MYSIDCEFYTNKFDSLELLVKDIIISCQDPNYEILKDGIGIGEEVVDFIIY
jgi:hypothetical protein